MDGAIDALVKILLTHVAFDIRHKRAPLSGFAPAPQLYWNAYGRGTPYVMGAAAHWQDRSLPIIMISILSQHPAIRSFAAVPQIA